MLIAPQVILLLLIFVGAQCRRLGKKKDAHAACLFVLLMPTMKAGISILYVAPLHAANSPDVIEGDYIIVLHSYLAKAQGNLLPPPLHMLLN